MAIKHVTSEGLLYLLQKLKIKFDTKVDKAEGKQLSTNDLTDDLKQKILDAGTSKFSGSYDDLTNKPDLTSLHSHTNKAALDKITDAKLTEWDSKQTAAQVESAVTGKGYQTAAQVQAAVVAAGHITKQIVETLPAAADAKENIIYLVLKASGTDGDVYDEYMLIAGKMEKMGDSKMDLTGYLKTSDLVAIANAEIDTLWNTVFNPAPAA